MPGASYIVAAMSSSSWRVPSVISATGIAACRKIGLGTLIIGKAWLWLGRFTFLKLQYNRWQCSEIVQSIVFCCLVPRWSFAISHGLEDGAVAVKLRAWQTWTR